MISDKHALFDPGSKYNRLRAAVRPADKLRGYFHWLSAQPAAPPEPGGAGRVRGAAPMLLAAPAARAAGRRLVLRLDEPDEVVAAAVKPAVVPAEGGGKQLELTVELHDHIPPYPVACRAFFIEPAVLSRLTTLDKSFADRPPLTVLQTVFRPEWVGYNLEAARILSALPEMDGTVDQDGAGAFDPAPLPDACRDITAIPERVYLVVAIDGPEV